MADADGVILAALQQSGCVDAGTAAGSWTTFESLAAIVSRCLARIQEADESADFGLLIPFEAPQGVAARHRVGSKLAGLLKELGYAGDCGYSHLLYPSEKDARSILSWLVGKLPRARPEEDAAATADAVLALSERLRGVRDGRGEGEDDELLLAIPEAEGDAAERAVSGAAVASILSAWKRERTLHLLPSRHVRGLRGHERIPLRTARVELPWVHDAPLSDHKRALFDAFPAAADRATSLLEALSAHAPRSRSSELDDRPLDGEQVQMDDLLEPDSVKRSTLAAATLEDPRPSGSTRESDSTLTRPSELAVVEGGRNVLGADPAPPVNDASRSSAAEDASASTERSRESIEDEIELLQAQTDKTQQRVAAMRTVIAKDRVRLHETQQRLAAGRAAQPALEKQLATEKSLLAMLPAAEVNVSKLEALCVKTQRKLDELALEWRRTRDPLVREQEELVASAGQSGEQARGRQLLAEMKTFREEMQRMAGTVQDKAQALKALEKALTSAQASNTSRQSRNSYTSRIMDIIKQVHKQKAEIAKIIGDITAMQKQLNASAEKLKRSEAVAEDKLFSAASNKLTSSSSGLGIAVSVGFSAGREPAANTAAYVECYRKFTQVRELFEELLGVIGDVGKQENGVRDLHNWIRQLEARDSSRHVDKVLADLHAVQQENSALHDQLRSASAALAGSTHAPGS